MKQIIYVPGLGAIKTVERQRRIVERWNNQDVTAVLFDPQWESPETAAAKFKRLLAFLDDTFPDGAVEVSAASAGGPLSIGLFAQREARIERLRLVCPKLHGAHKIGPHYQRLAPALLPTTEHCEEVLPHLTSTQRARITTYRPLYERVIELEDMQLDGAHNRRLPLFGHGVTIGVCLFTVLRP